MRYITISLLLVSLITFLTAYAINPNNRSVSNYRLRRDIPLSDEMLYRDSIVNNGKMCYISNVLDSLLVYEESTQKGIIYHSTSDCPFMHKHNSRPYYLIDKANAVSNGTICAHCESRWNFIRAAADSVIIRHKN